MRLLLLLALGQSGGDVSALIDRGIAERWTAEEARPAPAADDYGFLRRLSLDVRGVIPAPEEIRAFAADADPAKREKVVDAWLRSDAFVRFWAHRWAEDLTLNPTLKAKFQGLYDAYEGWLRDAIRSNMPYDRFMKRLLTAKGPLDLDPAAGFLLSGLNQKEQGAKEVVDRTARIFLGTQIRCAECHDHPFDDWTQEDFRGMAAFFVQSRAEVRTLMETGTATGWIADDPAKGSSAIYKSSAGSAGERESQRTAFARLVAADPQFARAAVNRHWGMLLGRGLMHPLDGFTSTRKPSHPRLLEELAADFVRSGYDVRRLMRGILLSRTYGLSSRRETADRSDERLFLRTPVTALTHDQLYASLLAATGFSTEAPAGKGKGAPRDLKESFLREFRPPLEENEPMPAPSEPTIAQALYLLNGELSSRSTSAAGRTRLAALLEREKDPLRRLEELFLWTLSRPPSAREVEVLSRKATQPEAYEDLFWALINSTEFVTRH